MDITSDNRVGEIAAHHPMATQVFARHGIDFCCGGGIPLREACEKRNLDTLQILEEIEQTLASPGPGAVEERWDRAPVEDLVRHIVDAYHVPLREELPRLEAMARKVARVHSDKDPERLGALLDTFLNLKGELDVHMAQEEDVLFPAILRAGDEPAVPILQFLDDHAHVGRNLDRLRELTGDYQVPAEACNTWRALWHGLRALETALHNHIHLENNVLFPRVSTA